MEALEIAESATRNRQAATKAMDIKTEVVEALVRNKTHESMSVARAINKAYPIDSNPLEAPQMPATTEHAIPTNGRRSDLTGFNNWNQPPIPFSTPRGRPV